MNINPFCGLLRLRQVQVHLVAVKVGVVRRAHALVEAERAAGQHARAVAHDGHLVQRRLPVEEHDVAVHQVPLDDVAHRQALGRLRGGGEGGEWAATAARAEGRDAPLRLPRAAAPPH